MRAFFDTNVWIYALTPDDPIKRGQAHRALERADSKHSVVLSTQVLLETFNVLTHKKGKTTAEALEMVQVLATRTVSVPTVASTLAALALAARYRLSTWDATMVQAALDTACDVLFTEDLQAGMRFGTLEVVNPFAPAVHSPAPPWPVGALTAASSRPRRRRQT